MTESDGDQAALSANPDVAALQAHSVFTTKDQAGAIAFASPLSYPLVADQLPALVANILH
jgi:iron complex transport system substrate-binding protein